MSQTAETPPIPEFFVILARLLNPHVTEVEQILGIKLESHVVMIEEMPADAYIFGTVHKDQKTADLLEPILRVIGPLVAVPALYKTVRVEVMLPSAEDVGIVGIEELDDEESRHVQNARRTYLPCLILLARVLGRRVEFVVGMGKRRAPFPANDSMIRLFSGVNPPGEFYNEQIQYVYGLPIHPKYMWVWGRSLTKGRGVPVFSDTKQPIAQIVNSTVYLLLPVISHYHQPASDMIFSKIVAAIGGAFRQMALGKLEPPAEATDAASIVKAASAETLAMVEGWNKRIGDLERDIVELQKELARKVMDLDDTRRVKGSFDHLLHQELPKHIEADVLRLQNHSLVERVCACDDGVHVDTRLVLIEHEDVKYRCGTFTIRVSRFGLISIWERETAHPDRVPHPHLPKGGSPCFGTAGAAIMRAGAERRLFDAIDMTLRWLQDGYAPHLAEHPITEWPVAEQEHGS